MWKVSWFYDKVHDFANVGGCAAILSCLIVVAVSFETRFLLNLSRYSVLHRLIGLCYVSMAVAKEVLLRSLNILLFFTTLIKRFH